MDMNHCPRSWLFVPGDSARKIDKARGTGADILIYDLEDSVAPDAKPDARALVAQTLAGRRVPVCVRVNPLSTDAFNADLDALSAAPPPLIMLPKCEGPQDIATAAQSLADRGMGSRLVVLATETARGIRSLMRSDWSHPRLAGITWGAEDLAADIGALTNKGPEGYEGVFALARDLCLLAAKEAGVWAIDTVYVDTHDSEGCTAEGAASFATGFDGKMAIHPAQVPAIHAAFSPTEAQVTHAQRILAALDGAGVAVLDGRMIDRPHARAAEKILALANPQHDGG